MEKKYNKSIYIFRRDLRLEDNTGLLKALENSQEVIPIFILNPKQISKENEFYNTNSIEFLFNSLKGLNSKLKNRGFKLNLFHGKQIEILSKLIKEEKIEAIYQNKDYTPFAKHRDKKIKELCIEKEIDCNLYDDYLLNSPQKIVKDDKTPYGVFTPFWKKSLNFEIEIPKKNNFENFKDIPSEEIEILDKLLEKKNENLFNKGGRDEALKIMQEQVKELQNYSDIRDEPFKNGTTTLSAHLKFGTISVRELYYFIKEYLGDEHPLLRQLYWRDFWTYIVYFHPKVFETTYIEKYKDLPWDYDEDRWKAWCEGKTGFPIVDAGMRELNETGNMHNRVRMIVASFLTKDLHISYKDGEKYFAQKLVDYDPSLNNGNWQWAASTGCDGQPYFRVFNPWRQQERFDPNCEYIKRWIPELKKFSSKVIHNLEKQRPLEIEYPKPIVKHEEERDQAKSMFKIMN